MPLAGYYLTSPAIDNTQRPFTSDCYVNHNLDGTPWAIDGDDYKIVFNDWIN